LGSRRTLTPVFKGSLNCRSAEQKCEEVRAQTVSAKPPSMVMAAKLRLSAIVEQAPYRPKKGTFESLIE
jgi:hypothetical protein